MKKTAIFGSTGSIGVNSLNVVDELKGRFEIVALSTHSNLELLLKQAETYQPSVVAITGTVPGEEVHRALKRIGVEVMSGPKALVELSENTDFDLLVNAVVGAAGFMPTLAAVRRGKTVALANKETLVMGGALITQAAREAHAQILPIDSEHSAIFQCLSGEDESNIEEIILTGSGGPFRTLDKNEFPTVTVAQALKHPNWSMGKKITIDSATMMNKGLEVIEARWLFSVLPEHIRVVIHPQSIIHSMVLFRDGSIKAQLGLPDMRIPIQLAMTFPDRQASTFPRLDFSQYQRLTFEPPDPDKFPALRLAYEAAETGGTAPAVMNAANEEAVYRFLNHEIRFDQITAIIEETLHNHDVQSDPDAQALLQADQRTRVFARKWNF